MPSGPLRVSEPHSLILGQCVDVLRSWPDACVDAVCTDPPYALAFMGRSWDSFKTPQEYQAWCLEWAAECFRVLKPGGHMLAFGHPKKVHRMTASIEDAGFEIRDTLHWLYYNGNPASVDVSKVMDKMHGVFDQRPPLGASSLHSRGQSNGYPSHIGLEGASTIGPTEGLHVTGPASDDAKKWNEWGTGLNPAIEPVVLARKPLPSAPPWPGEGRTPAGWRVAANVLEHGTGALNIRGCRIPWGDPRWPGPGKGPEDVPTITGAVGRPKTGAIGYGADRTQRTLPVYVHPKGRWPSNVIYCPKPSTKEREAGCETLPSSNRSEVTGRKEGSVGMNNPRAGRRSKGEIKNTHVTVKPIELMRWLCRLITPPDGILVDPFLGSGTTLCAAELEGLRAVGIEKREESYRIAEARVRHWAEVAKREHWTRNHGSINAILRTP